MASDGMLRETLAGLVKLLLNARLFALLFTVLWLPAVDDDRQVVVVWLLAIVGATSLLPLLLWDRVAPWLLRHPAALVVDLLVSAAVLALVGFDTPFGLFVLTTALVAGVLYDWTGAAVMSLALLGSYLIGSLLAEAPLTLAAVLTTPVLIPVAATGGAALRHMVVRQHEASVLLAEQALATAANDERTRLAREMHDTLAKTLQGISLSATALPRLLDLDPQRAASAARQLADTADQAADEARALLVDLRADELDRPLGEVVSASAQAWARRTGMQVDVAAVPCEGLTPSARYELFCILREALHNAHQHGRATRVEIALAEDDDGAVELRVTDDGKGFTPPPDLADLTDGGHFGVIGMSERAATVGGSFALDSRVGGPTTVVVRLAARTVQSTQPAAKRVGVSQTEGVAR